MRPDSGDVSWDVMIRHGDLPDGVYSLQSFQA